MPLMFAGWPTGWATGVKERLEEVGDEANEEVHQDGGAADDIERREEGAVRASQQRGQMGGRRGSGGGLDQM